MEKPIAHIEDASLIVFRPAGEKPYARLFGHLRSYPPGHAAEGHTVTPGKYIETSVVVRVSEKEVETQRTIYRVGSWRVPPSEAVEFQ